MPAKKLKKDFDKERMYAKIMPTTFTESEESLPEKEADNELPKQSAAKSEIISGENKKKKSSEPEYILRNYMEDVILEKYGHTIKMLKACTCEKCKKDIMAYALNELPSHYIAVKPVMIEDTVRELRSSLEVKVSSALIQAVQHVKANPQH